MTNAEKFWLILGIVFIIVINIFAYKQLRIEIYDNQEKSYCGEILNKSLEDHPIKHGSRTELYMTINFDNVGAKTINVTPTTFYINKIGDRVCFDLSNYFIHNSEKSFIGLLCLILSIAIDFLLLIFLLIEFVGYFNKILNNL